MVPRAGIEPAILFRPRILSPVRIPVPPPGQVIIFWLEVRAGIEPAHRGFADPSVTTSPSHHYLVVDAAGGPTPHADWLSQSLLVKEKITIIV